MGIDSKWWISRDFLRFCLFEGDITKGFLGHHCKVVYKVRGFEKNSVITGEVLDFNNAGFFVVEDQNGIHYINKSAIISIKPQGKRGDK